MKYSKPLITPPIKWDTQRFDIPLGTIGDTLHITPIPSINRSITLPPAETVLPVTTKPSVRLVESFKGVSSMVVEGGDLTITVGLSKASPVDITVDLSVTNDGLVKVSSDWRKDHNVNGILNNVDYITEYFTNTSDVDFATLTLQVVIPAGQLQASTTLSTVDDLTLTKGKGSYRVGKVTIVAQDNPDYMIHHSCSESLLLLEDANDYPVWGGGEVYLWGKMGELCEWERIYDAEGLHAKLTFDWEKDENGVVVDFSGESYQIDLNPLHAIQLRPDQVNLPVDTDEVAPVDLTTNLPSFRVQIIGGRD